MLQLLPIVVDGGAADDVDLPWRQKILLDAAHYPCSKGSAGRSYREFKKSNCPRWAAGQWRTETELVEVTEEFPTADGIGLVTA